MRRLALHSTLAAALLTSGAMTGAFAQTDGAEREVRQHSQMRVTGEGEGRVMRMTDEAMAGEGRRLILRMDDAGWHGMMGAADMPMALRVRPGVAAHGMMGGAAFLYGVPPAAQQEMTPERVRAFLEARLEWHGNPRLEIGEIATLEDGSITAEIITVDGSLVQKLAFNRYPGLFRQVPE